MVFKRDLKGQFRQTSASYCLRLWQQFKSKSNGLKIRLLRLVEEPRESIRRCWIMWLMFYMLSRQSLESKASRVWASVYPLISARGSTWSYFYSCTVFVMFTLKRYKHRTHFRPACSLSDDEKCSQWATRMRLNQQNAFNQNTEEFGGTRQIISKHDGVILLFCTLRETVWHKALSHWQAAWHVNSAQGIDGLAGDTLPTEAEFGELDHFSWKCL